MRALVFADAGAKRRLEAILHPLIGDEAQRQAALAGGRPVVFDVPLLAESSHWRAARRPRAGRRLREATQVAARGAAPGLATKPAQRVIAQQASRGRAPRLADAVIYNDGVASTAWRRGARRCGSTGAV